MKTLQQCTMYFKGGAGGTPQVPAPPSPAATESSLEVTNAKMDAKTLAKRKMGIGSTILAGDTSSLQSKYGDGSKTTLLGGG